MFTLKTLEQHENIASINPDIQVVDLESPVMMGTLEINSIEIRKPNVTALQGVKIADLLNGDVTAICAGTGIMPSLSFYYNRPQWKNDPMGEGPVLRALVEMIDAPAYTEIKAEQQYDKIK